MSNRKWSGRRPLSSDDEDDDDDDDDDDDGVNDLSLKMSVIDSWLWWTGSICRPQIDR